MSKTKWPTKEEVELLRWTNGHTQYHSFNYGFCRAQDCCEECNQRVRVLCRLKELIEKIKWQIIKRHYGIKKGW